METIIYHPCGPAPRRAPWTPIGGRYASAAYKFPFGGGRTARDQIFPSPDDLNCWEHSTDANARTNAPRSGRSLA